MNWIRGPGAAGTSSLYSWFFPERCLAIDQLAAFPNVGAASVLPSINALRAWNFGFSIPADHLVVSMTLADLRIRSAEHHPTPPLGGGKVPTELIDLEVRWSPDGVNLGGSSLRISLDQLADGLQGSYAFAGTLPTVSQLVNSGFSLLFGISVEGVAFGIDHFLLEVVTIPPPPEAPTLSGYASSGSCSLSWNFPGNASSCVLKRGSAAGGPYPTAVYAGPLTSFTETGLTNGVTYRYVVVASGDGGSSGNSNEVALVPTTSPSPPDAPVMSAVGVDDGVKVWWSSIVGATSYEVWKQDAGAGTFALVKSSADLQVVDPSVNPGETACYKVRAVAGGLVSAFSAVACAIRTRYRKGHVRLEAARSFQDIETGGYDPHTGLWIPGHLKEKFHGN